MQLERVGNVIEKLRKEQGLTQADLARRSGVEQGMISRIETDNTKRLDMIDKLLAALGYEVKFMPAEEENTPVADGITGGE